MIEILSLGRVSWWAMGFYSTEIFYIATKHVDTKTGTCFWTGVQFPSVPPLYTFKIPIFRAFVS